jgi:hypothetical protein
MLLFREFETYHVDHLYVKRVEAPEVDQDDDIRPEISKHFGDHPKKNA